MALLASDARRTATLALVSAGVTAWLAGCALPGPPRPQPQNTTQNPCPTVALATVADGVYAFKITAATANELDVWRSTDGAPEELVATLELAPGTHQWADTPAPLAGLAYVFEPYGRPQCSPAAVELTVEPAPPPPPAPLVSVTGLAVRIDPPQGAPETVAIFRRPLNEPEADPLLIDGAWETGAPYIDTEVDPGVIYVYSLASVGVVHTADGRELVAVGQRGPETYAPVADPARVAAPPSVLDP